MGREGLKRRIIEKKCRTKRGMESRKIGMLEDIINGRSFTQIKDVENREKWRKSS